MLKHNSTFWQDESLFFLLKTRQRSATFDSAFASLFSLVQDALKDTNRIERSTHSNNLSFLHIKEQCLLKDIETLFKDFFNTEIIAYRNFLRYCITIASASLRNTFRSRTNQPFFTSKRLIDVFMMQIGMQ